MSDDQQTSIDPFHELNHYDDRDAEFRSEAVYTEPRRTLANGWRKFHADRDCGSDSVRYVEATTHRPVSERRADDLYCWQCGHRVDEDEILFIGGQWFSEHGWQYYGRTLEDLALPRERVLELGPSPDRDALVDALELTRIERGASVPHMFSFGRSYREDCDDCGASVPVRFDRRCRMCYDGEWTDRLQRTVESLGIAVRERNDSYRHRLEDEIDPLSIKDRAFEDKILWRRHDAENVPKLVEVTQCLKDDSDGHWEYVLTDMTHTSEWRYHEDDLVDCFWDTKLYNDEHAKPVQDERIREVYQRVCDHSFSTIRDAETLESDGEQCLHCRKRREQ